jgi:hypothetical protein
VTVYDGGKFQESTSLFPTYAISTEWRSRIFARGDWSHSAQRGLTSKAFFVPSTVLHCSASSLPEVNRYSTSSNVFVCCLFIFLSARIVAKQAGSYMYRRALSLGLLRQISLWLRLHFVHSRSCRAGQAQDDVKGKKKDRTMSRWA